MAINNKPSSWMFAAERLVSYLGADYHLMRGASSRVLSKFYISAVAILLILVTSAVSINYAIDLLFHKPLVEIVLSLFLAALFVLIYIFLINTFTKEELTRNMQDQKKLKVVFTVSNILRTGFVVFMAFILSKPLEIFVYRTQLDTAVEHYKAQLLAAHKQKIQALFEDDLQSIMRKKEMLQRFSRIYNQNETQLELGTVNANANEDSLSNEIARLYQLAEQKVNQSDFFLYRVKIVEKAFPAAWLICISTVLLFLLPGYLIYSISDDDIYFKQKKAIEVALIQNHYAAIEHEYTALFLKRYQKKVEIYTVFEDPPFNTKRKPKPSYQPQVDFLKKYSS